jgi:hypothetical protein
LYKSGIVFQIHINIFTETFAIASLELNNHIVHHIISSQIFFGFFALFSVFCQKIFVVKVQSVDLKIFVFFLISLIKSFEFVKISFAHFIANKNSFFFFSDK